MKAETLRLLVMTPEKELLLKEDLLWVRATLIDGEIGIQANHTPLIGETLTGPVHFGSENEEDAINLEAGILKVDQLGVTIFTSGIADSKTSHPKINDDELKFERLANDLLQRFKID